RLQLATIPTPARAVHPRDVAEPARTTLGRAAQLVAQVAGPAGGGDDQVGVDDRAVDPYADDGPVLDKDVLGMPNHHGEARLLDGAATEHPLEDPSPAGQPGHAVREVGQQPR